MQLQFENSYFTSHTTAKGHSADVPQRVASNNDDLSSCSQHVSYDILLQYIPYETRFCDSAQCMQRCLSNSTKISNTRQCQQQPAQAQYMCNPRMHLGTHSKNVIKRKCFIQGMSMTSDHQPTYDTTINKTGSFLSSPAGRPNGP
jgi:hypothetical protein